MNSKPTPQKTNKIETKSKKIYKPSKIPSKTTSPTKTKSLSKHCLSYYLSNQCFTNLAPFMNISLFPIQLQQSFKNANQIFSAYNTFKTQDTQEKFDEKLDKMRYLTNSQENLIERFLQDKYAFTKKSGNLQEIYCYSTAKNLLLSQFHDFFLKRNDFFLKFQETAEKKGELAENSFTATNVSSPSINSSLGPFGTFSLENNYIPMMNAKINPEINNNRYFFFFILIIFS